MFSVRECEARASGGATRTFTPLAGRAVVEQLPAEADSAGVAQSHVFVVAEETPNAVAVVPIRQTDAGEDELARKRVGCQHKQRPQRARAHHSWRTSCNGS